MLIKSADDRARDIDTLTALISHPAASIRARQDIDLEIRKIRAGARGEAEAAYEIDFDHKASTNWAVLHDLRLEYQGRVAQIDHLLVNRCLDVWVCESKHFQQGVAINEHGEFTAFYGNRAVGIPSPLEQNRKHLEVLRAVLDSSLVQLPTRLGMAIRPALHSVVLISKNARITRPAKAIPGLDAVVKSDRLRDLINRQVEGNSTIGTLVSVAKMVAPDTLESFARQLARLHRPGSFDWAAKFGVAQAERRASAAAAPIAAAAAEPSVATSVVAAALPTPPAAAAQCGPDHSSGRRGEPPARGPAPATALPHATSPSLSPANHPAAANPEAAPLPEPVMPHSGAGGAPAEASVAPWTDPRARTQLSGQLSPASVPASAQDSGTGRGEPVDDGIARLSTSKLGARLGARNVAEMSDRLVRAGYLVSDGTGFVLTDKGKACGAIFVEKSRFGPYFLWPADLQP
ncbi:MAG: NERD domain-containing protein [Xylophilus ampelinus]